MSSNKITQEKLQEWSKSGHRSIVGDTLVMLANERSDMVALTADLTPTARLIEFRDTFPDRFFDVGIAEQNLIDFTAGLSVEGLLPFAVAMAAIVPMRCAEQMRVSMAYMNLNAKVISIEAGVRFGPLGNTHYAMDDIAVVRTMPNFTILCPSDPMSVHMAIRAAADHDGPVYIRLTGGPGFPAIYNEDFDFQIGKAVELKEGKDVAFISTGSMLAETMAASELLEAKGISTRVIDMHTVKPLDTDILDKVFAENKLLVTVEEHSSIGGLGSAVAEYKAGFANTPKQIIASLGDKFQEVGDHKYITTNAGLKAPQLAELAKANL